MADFADIRMTAGWPSQRKRPRVAARPGNMADAGHQPAASRVLSQCDGPPFWPGWSTTARIVLIL